MHGKFFKIDSDECNSTKVVILKHWKFWKIDKNRELLFVIQYSYKISETQLSQNFLSIPEYWSPPWSFCQMYLYEPASAWVCVCVWGGGEYYFRSVNDHFVTLKKGMGNFAAELTLKETRFCLQTSIHDDVGCFMMRNFTARIICINDVKYAWNERWLTVRKNYFQLWKLWANSNNMMKIIIRFISYNVYREYSHNKKHNLKFTRNRIDYDMKRTIQIVTFRFA